MAKPRNGVLAALDIGSSKVVCLIASLRPEGGVRVNGVGHHAAHGVRAGAIVDMQAAETAILTAVGAAEDLAGERLHGVIANISAGRPSSQTFGVEVQIDGHEVSDADLRRVYGHGQTRNGGDDRSLIHCIPVAYSIDGGRGIRDPRGMFGRRLGVNMHLVTAESGAVKNLTTCISRCHLDVEEVVVSPYAAGLACLVEDEIDLGTTVIDMGGGTTSLAVFYDGHVVLADVIPLGGSHVTNDIARGLSTPLVHAERMKLLYGSVLPSSSDEQELIDVPLVGEEDRNEPNHVPRSLLVGIIRPRMEEIFDLVRDRLETSGAARLVGRRMVLTGGASQLAGVRELSTLMLGKQVRLGRPMRVNGLAEAASGPAFSAAAGLLRFALERHGRPDFMERGAADPNGKLGRLGQWLRESIQ